MRPAKNQLEKDIESECCDYAEATGWFTCKFVSPGTRGVPDRLFIRNGVHVFGEFKKPGEEPTAQQTLRHKKMRRHGAIVFWWDNYDQFKRNIDAL